MTLRRCQGCGHMHDKRLVACPECGTAKHPANPALASERFRQNLLSQAHHAKLYG